jgi:hypothetical protein
MSLKSAELKWNCYTLLIETLLVACIRDYTSCRQDLSILGVEKCKVISLH